VALSITLNFLILGIWTYPGEGRALNPLRRIFEPYVGIFGLWQWWHMLAQPPMRNIELAAKIFRSDSSIELWRFPSMHKMSTWERFRNDPYNKWQERLIPGQNKILVDACRYVARHALPQPNRRPTRIEIWRSVTRIPDPIRGPFYLRGDRDPIAPMQLLYSYPVQVEDLGP
jgi:hypothetical protein